jgi:hypothetical protein
MNDDDLFLENLRRDAASLRFEPDDDVLWSRLQARVRVGVRTIRAAPTVAQLLASWMRPVAACLIVLAIAGSVVVGVENRNPERSATALDALSQPPSDMPSMDEEILSGSD